MRLWRDTCTHRIASQFQLRFRLRLIVMVCLYALVAQLCAAAGGLPPANPMNRAQYSDHYAQKLAAARTAYFQVLTHDSHSADQAAHQALEALEESYPGDATAEAYSGSLEMLDAARSWQIWNLRHEAAEGLARLDHAVTLAPNDPEVRFIRAATSWHLPDLYHRRQQCESDFAWLSTHAVDSSRRATLPPELAAASLNYWGQILMRRGQSDRARAAFQQAVDIAPQSPGAQDAARRLRNLH